MKADSKGYLTIEATISLIAFLLFMMFIMDFGHVYRTQNLVAHGALQTGKMLSFNSFSYDQTSAIDLITDTLKLFAGSENSEIELTWVMPGGKDEAVELVFRYFVSEEDMKRYQIESLDFSETEVEGDSLIINLSYDIKLPFAVFNLEKITMHQRVVCGLWK